MRDGSLTLSAAAELQWAFDRQRRRGAISGIASSAPARATPAGSAAENAPATEEPPADSAPAAAPSASDPAPPLVLDAAGRRTLLEEATGKSARQVRRMLADLDPELAVPADRMRPLGDGRYAATTRAGRRAAAGRKPAGAATATAKPRASGRAIPAAVRRQVWQRDGGRCSYVDRETGRRCNSRHLIEMNHILPYAPGGSADPRNVRFLCGVHHRHRHAPDGSRRIPEG